MLKLKKINKEEEYDQYLCAAVRCNARSDIIIATGPKTYGLCDTHWCQKCDEEDEQEDGV